MSDSATTDAKHKAPEGSHGQRENNVLEHAPRPPPPTIVAPSPCGGFQQTQLHSSPLHDGFVSKRMSTNSNVSNDVAVDLVPDRPPSLPRAGSMAPSYLSSSTVPVPFTSPRPRSRLRMSTGFETPSVVFDTLVPASVPGSDGCTTSAADGAAITATLAAAAKSMSTAATSSASASASSPSPSSFFMNAPHPMNWDHSLTSLSASDSSYPVSRASVQTPAHANSNIPAASQTATRLSLSSSSSSPSVAPGSDRLGERVATGAVSTPTPTLPTASASTSTSASTLALASSSADRSPSLQPMMLSTSPEQLSSVDPDARSDAQATPVYFVKGNEADTALVDALYTIRVLQERLVTNVVPHIMAPHTHDTAAASSSSSSSLSSDVILSPQPQTQPSSNASSGVSPASSTALMAEVATMSRILNGLSDQITRARAFANMPDRALGRSLARAVTSQREDQDDDERAVSAAFAQSVLPAHELPSELAPPQQTSTLHRGSSSSQGSSIGGSRDRDRDRYRDRDRDKDLSDERDNASRARYLKERERNGIGRPMSPGDRDRDDRVVAASFADGDGKTERDSIKSVSSYTTAVVSDIPMLFGSPRRRTSVPLLFAEVEGRLPIELNVGATAAAAAASAAAAAAAAAATGASTSGSAEGIGSGDVSAAASPFNIDALSVSMDSGSGGDSSTRRPGNPRRYANVFTTSQQASGLVNPRYPQQQYQQQPQQHHQHSHRHHNPRPQSTPDGVEAGIGSEATRDSDASRSNDMASSEANSTSQHGSISGIGSHIVPHHRDHHHHRGHHHHQQDEAMSERGGSSRPKRHTAGALLVSQPTTPNAHNNQHQHRHAHHAHHAHHGPGGAVEADEPCSVCKAGQTEIQQPQHANSAVLSSRHLHRSAQNHRDDEDRSIQSTPRGADYTRRLRGAGAGAGVGAGVGAANSADAGAGGGGDANEADIVHVLTPAQPCSIPPSSSSSSSAASSSSTSPSAPSSSAAPNDSSSSSSSFPSAASPSASERAQSSLFQSGRPSPQSNIFASSPPLSHYGRTRLVPVPPTPQGSVIGLATFSEALDAALRTLGQSTDASSSSSSSSLSSPRSSGSSATSHAESVNRDGKKKNKEEEEADDDDDDEDDSDVDNDNENDNDGRDGSQDASGVPLDYLPSKSHALSSGFDAASNASGEKALAAKKEKNKGEEEHEHGPRGHDTGDAASDAAAIQTNAATSSSSSSASSASSSSSSSSTATLSASTASAGGVGDAGASASAHTALSTFIDSGNSLNNVGNACEWLSVTRSVGNSVTRSEEQREEGAETGGDDGNGYRDRSHDSRSSNRYDDVDYVYSQFDHSLPFPEELDIHLPTGNVASRALFSTLRIPRGLDAHPQLTALWPKLATWDFDIFELDVASCHNPLTTLMIAIADRFEFFTKWDIPRDRYVRLARRLESSYHENPYHNAIHAADVVQNVFAMYMSTEDVSVHAGLSSDVAKMSPMELGYMQPRPVVSHALLTNRMTRTHSRNSSAHAPPSAAPATFAATAADAAATGTNVPESSSATTTPTTINVTVTADAAAVTAAVAAAGRGSVSSSAADTCTTPPSTVASPDTASTPTSSSSSVTPSAIPLPLHPSAPDTPSSLSATPASANHRRRVSRLSITNTSKHQHPSIQSQNQAQLTPSSPSSASFGFSNRPSLNLLHCTCEHYSSSCSLSAPLSSSSSSSSSGSMSSCPVHVAIPPMRGVAASLDGLDLLCLVLAAAAHDVGHPGLSNQYLIDTDDEIALRYNDQAVLENFHCAQFFTLLRDDACNVFCNFTRPQYMEARETIIQCILGTDMKAHVPMLSAFNAAVKSRPAPVFNPKDRVDRLLLMRAVVHTCDVANPTKALPICTRWADSITDEWYAQGDAELKNGLPITATNDRTVPARKFKAQVAFIDMCVAPLYESLAHVAPVARQCLENMERNRQYWIMQADEFAAAEAQKKGATSSTSSAPALLPRLPSAQSTPSAPDSVPPVHPSSSAPIASPSAPTAHS